MDNLKNFFFRCFAYLLRPTCFDELYLKVMFRKAMGYWMDFNNPMTFSEKLQWLKLYDHNPLYTIMVDKFKAKEYVRNLIGEKYIIPTLGVWSSFDDIDFDRLPNQFVLKCTHDSGGLIVCKDKSRFNKFRAKQKLEACLKSKFYRLNREWPYKNVPPRIIAEKYMEDAETKELRDYKFFCFDGVVKSMFIASDRQSDCGDTKFDFFDDDFNHLDFLQGHPNANQIPAKPICFEEMKLLAAKLSQGIPHVRVDLYEMNGQVYFGELTFFHYSGLTPFKPIEWDYKFGEWLLLPKLKKI